MPTLKLCNVQIDGVSGTTKSSAQAKSQVNIRQEMAVTAALFSVVTPFLMPSTTSKRKTIIKSLKRGKTTSRLPKSTLSKSTEGSLLKPKTTKLQLTQKIVTTPIVTMESTTTATAMLTSLNTIIPVEPPLSTPQKPTNHRKSILTTKHSTSAVSSTAISARKSMIPRLSRSGALTPTASTTTVTSRLLTPLSLSSSTTLITKKSVSNLKTPISRLSKFAAAKTSTTVPPLQLQRNSTSSVSSTAVTAKKSMLKSIATIPRLTQSAASTPRFSQTTASTLRGMKNDNKATTSKQTLNSTRGSSTIKPMTSKSSTAWKSFQTSGLSARNRTKSTEFGYDLSQEEHLFMGSFKSAMKTVPDGERELLKNGQRGAYLAKRYEHSPDRKYNFPEATSWRIGWLHNQQVKQRNG